MLSLQENDYKGIILDEAHCRDLSPAEICDILIGKIADRIALELPEEEIQQEAELLLQGYHSKLRYENFGSGHLPSYMLQTEEEAEQIMEEFRRQAASEYCSEKILSEIIKAEGLQVTKEELEEEAQAMALRQDTTVELIKRFMGEDLSMLERDLLKKKARHLICANAKIQ